MFGAATVLVRLFPMCSEFTLAFFLSCFSLTQNQNIGDKARRIPLVSHSTILLRRIFFIIIIYSFTTEYFLSVFFIFLLLLLLIFIFLF